MKIFLAEKNVPGMTREEIVNFLEKGRMILRLGTLDSTTGGPVIHPVWYYFANDRFFFFTDKDASKLRNVKRESAVYFTIDIDTRPYIGVRGKGTARVVPESEETIELKEKIVRKYLDRSDPRYNMAIEKARSNRSIVLQVIPSYLHCLGLLEDVRAESLVVDSSLMGVQCSFITQSLHPSDGIRVV